MFHIIHNYPGTSSSPIKQQYRHILISAEEPPATQQVKPDLLSGGSYLESQFLIIPVSETFFPSSSFTASFCVTGGWEGEGRAPDKSDISDD